MPAELRGGGGGKSYIVVSESEHAERLIFLETVDY